MAKASAADRVVTLLIQNGWESAGVTNVEQVRIGTAKVPVYGGIGGELRRFGGRLRFHRPDTDLFATVGRNSVCFYHRQDREATGFRNYATGREFDYIAEAASKAATSDMPRTADEIVREVADRARAVREAQERVEAEAARQARLDAGDRILVMTGTKARLFERKTGFVVVYWDDLDKEVPVCCWMQGRWLIQHMHRNHAVGSPTDHTSECVGEK